MNPPTLFDDDDLDAVLRGLVTEYGYEVVMDRLRRFIPTTEASSAPARPTDPDTSHAAAKTELDVGRFTPRSKKAKLLAVYAGDDFTDQEATARVIGRNAPPSRFEGTRRRCSELREVHFIYDTGKRRPNIGVTDDSVVCGITQAGLDAIGRLEETGWSR